MDENCLGRRSVILDRFDSGGDWLLQVHGNYPTTWRPKTILRLFEVKIIKIKTSSTREHVSKLRPDRTIYYVMKEITAMIEGIKADVTKLTGVLQFMR